MADEKIEYPQAQDDPNEYSWTEEELAEIQRHIAKYPEKRSASMPTLWIAQRKWGWLPQKAMQLVADTLDMSYAEVYGVATFYTQYLKDNRAPHLIEVCTCFGCHVTGGQEFYDTLCKDLEVDDQGVSKCKRFYVREAECLGACDTPAVVQVDNKTYVHRAQEKDFHQLLESIAKGEEVPYEPIPLQDQRRFKK